MRILPIVPTSSAATPDPPRFVSHAGTAMLLWRSHDTAVGEPPSIGIANEEVSSLPCIGIRAVIAPRFDARFFSEAVHQGILPVALSDETIAAIGARLEVDPRQKITVDLDSQTIDVPALGTFSFETLPRVRRKLLHGMSDLDELLEHRDVAASFRTEDSHRRPWLYTPGPTEGGRPS